METWLDCVKIYDKATETLADDLEPNVIEMFNAYVKRIGRKPRYNVWYDTLSPKCIGADDTYKNSLVPNEASFLTDREKFVNDPRWGLGFAHEHYRGFMRGVPFKVYDDAFYEDIPELKKFEGASILILGGGPSTNASKWKHIKADYVWSCNHFYKHPEIVKQAISLTYVNAETSMLVPELAEYVTEHNTVCAADTSITRPPAILESFNNTGVPTLLFNQRVFLTSGAAPKLLSLAVMVGASKIYFVGMDGWRKEQIEMLDAGDHAFEPGKKLKVSSNYNFDFQRRETVVYWDYFLNFTGKNVEFQNLGETYKHCMTAGISKIAFPLKKETT